jgi:protein phosphatase 1E
MQTVMAITNDICQKYLDNNMLYSLPSPGWPHHIVSVFAAKNKRRRMEDRHVVVHDLNTMFNIQEASPSSYYAIFDGHAGHDAAAYSAAHLHQFLAESKHFVANPEQALHDAFCKTDALFIDKCNVERFNSGTTAVCALLRPKENTLYIAWVGDSQALLVNQGRVLQCVNPHKPCRTVRFFCNLNTTYYLFIIVFRMNENESKNKVDTCAIGVPGESTVSWLCLEQ